MTSTLQLRPFRPSDEAAATAAHAELAADGFGFLLDRDQAASWADYLALLARLERGAELPADRVRASLLAAEAGGELVGRSSVRYRLNGWLAEHGGHVGYGVRPGFRRRGHATAILLQSLELLRADGVERALVICSESNVGSRTVIERCGGVFERHAEADGGELKRRYWIEL